MAILEAPKSSSRIRIEGLVPKGTYIATCIAIEDQFGVQRAKYDDPTTLETVNLTSFYFGLKNKQGEMFLIRSKPFKMSLHEKSALFQFLKSWTAEPPRPGFDTETMVGKGAQITIEHGMSQKGRTFANIGAISPVMEGLEGKVVPMEAYLPYLDPVGGVATPATTIDESDEVPF